MRVEARAQSYPSEVSAGMPFRRGTRIGDNLCHLQVFAALEVSLRLPRSCAEGSTFTVSGLL